MRQVGKRDESVNAERATVVHVDPQAVADIQQAMQDDLLWRQRGGPRRVKPAPVPDLDYSLRSLERLVGRQQPLKSL